VVLIQAVVEPAQFVPIHVLSVTLPGLFVKPPFSQPTASCSGTAGSGRSESVAVVVTGCTASAGWQYAHRPVPIIG
jgi:hypothetical protein